MLTTEVDALYVSRVQAARVLDCSVQMIDKMLREGRIPASYLGTTVRIAVADLKAALEPYDPKKPRGVRVPRSKQVAAKATKKRGR